jgi:HAD superfamily hydrolase (TIGR01509 family)
MNKFTDIALITLDLDDTLWPCDSVIRTAEEALYEFLQRQASRLAEAHDINSMRDHRLALMTDHPEIAHDVTAVRQSSLCFLLEEFDYPQALAQEAMAVFLEVRNRVNPFPDVQRTLTQLMRDYCVVSVTNGNANVQLTPLAGHFHFSLSAADVGAAKPAPDIFHQALDHSAVAAHRALHVGDDPELDILAAQRVGMHTVWMNRNASMWPEDLPPPDANVENMHELIALLGG